jgi:AraC-like DNA-binding protein
LDLSSIGIPEVPMLGRYEYHSARPGLPMHGHRATLEICYLARGRQTYRVNGDDYHLTGGDFFVTLPGELHDTAGRPEEPGILYWIKLRVPRRGAGFFDLPARNGSVLIRNLLHMPQRHFFGGMRPKTLIDEIFSLYDRPADPLRRISIRVAVVRFLLEVLGCAHEDPYTRHSPLFAGIVETIRSSPEKSHSLSSLAAKVGLSLPWFKARFKTEFGATPHEFILRSKMEAARELLARGESVTEVAMRLGFSSSQYFATLFKRFYHQTPTEFRTGQPIPRLVVPKHIRLPDGDFY